MTQSTYFFTVEQNTKTLGSSLSLPRGKEYAFAIKNETGFSLIFHLLKLDNATHSSIRFLSPCCDANLWSHESILICKECFSLVSTESISFFVQVSQNSRYFYNRDSNLTKYSELFFDTFSAIIVSEFISSRIQELYDLTDHQLANFSEVWSVS